VSMYEANCLDFIFYF